MIVRNLNLFGFWCKKILYFTFAYYLEYLRELKGQCHEMFDHWYFSFYVSRFLKISNLYFT